MTNHQEAVHAMSEAMKADVAKLMKDQEATVEKRAREEDFMANLNWYKAKALQIGTPTTGEVLTVSPVFMLKLIDRYWWLQAQRSGFPDHLA